MNYAILLSGGTGTRIGGDIPKQYMKIGEEMMIFYSLRTLIASEHIDKIVIVADDAWKDDIINGVAGAPKIAGIAKPGENRQGSIINGLKMIESLNGDDSDGANKGSNQNVDTVFVHDAARPLLSEDLIGRCFNALPGHDGVMPVLPMKDTVYYCESTGKAGVGKITELMDRDRLFAGQAPELFVFDKYLEANRALSKQQLSQIRGSSEPAILAGMDIVTIPGDEKNFKVTTKEDLKRFSDMIES